MRIETLSERIANAENKIGKKQRTILLHYQKTVSCTIRKKHNNQSQKKSASGIWNSVADPQKIPLEEGAWERDVAERYGKDGENT